MIQVILCNVLCSLGNFLSMQRRIQSYTDYIFLLDSGSDFQYTITNCTIVTKFVTLLCTCITSLANDF
jgi:hypothetical protein